MTTFAIPDAAPRSVGRSVLQLAAVESRRLLRHPAFLAGLLGSLVLVWLSSTRDDKWVGDRYSTAIVAWVWLWLGTFVSAAAMAGRDRWLQDADLFPGTPISPTVRLRALLIALAGPVTVAAIGAAGAAIWFTTRGGFDLGPGRSQIDPPLAHWIQVPVLAALAGTAGIAVAQLPRKRLIVAGLLALFTVFSSVYWLLSVYPVRVLVPFMYPAYGVSILRFDTTALWWHLGYVIGVALLLVWAAMGLADRSTSRRRLLLAAVVIVAVCATGQLVTAAPNS